MAIAQTSAHADANQIDSKVEYLQIAHTRSHEIAQSGDLVYVTFTIENTSDRLSRDILVQIDITADTFVEAYAQNAGTYDESLGLWHVSKLKAEENATLSLSLLMKSNHNIDYQAIITKIGRKSIADEALKTQGIINGVEEDCLVVFNDFSTNAEVKRRGLYADCVAEYPNNFLQVFDRWGALVYEKENYDNSWTGKRHPKFTKFGREELEEGTYYYVLSFPESERTEKTGWIYISE